MKTDGTFLKLSKKKVKGFIDFTAEIEEESGVEWHPYFLPTLLYIYS